MKTTSINSDLAPAAIGHYSQALLVEQSEKFLFVSGQVPETTQGQVPGDFEAQCKLAWSNVLAQLDAAGMSVNNLVKATTYLASRDHIEANRQIRQAILGDHRPALTIIVCEIFDPQWLLEIDAIAAA